MRAVVVHEHGDFDILKVETIPVPEPGPGEVAVEVKACGVNHLDLWVRKGVPGYKFPLPLIPGNDIAGVVAAVGAGADGVAVGDPVVVAPGTSCGHCPACLQGRDHRCRHYRILGEHRNGGYAERVVVPRPNVLPKPAELSFEEAAGVGIPFLTAWHMLVDRAELRVGEWVLVQAGGSGVGSAAIQIAKLLGAEVITTASTDTKLERARGLGADYAINYRDADVASRVKEITGGRGVDVVVEHVGADSWTGSVRSLAWHGRLVTCGATTGSKVEVELRHLFFKAQALMGSTMGSKGEFVEVLEHAGRGRLRPVIDRVLPLSEAPEAHRLLAERQVFGKVVLVP